jgi:type III pantothenate kinase
MTLLIDLGNSALKWARVDSLARGEVHTLLHRAGGDWAATLAAAWRDAPPRAFGCSVAGAAERAQIERAAQTCGVALTWCASQARGGALVNGYREPTQLGADRWHALRGASARHAGVPFVLATAGTALTVDAVLPECDGARFIGGAIAPGTRLMLGALASGTAGLPEARGTAVDFPDNTDDAIATGAADAHTGLVLRFVERLAQRAGRAPRLLVSGGDAEALAARLRAAGAAPSIEHNLVLAGLALRAAEER